MRAEDEPILVARARQRAADAGFTMSSHRQVGELLAVLAAGTPAEARILEIGTGTGMALGWIVHGLGRRSDARVLSVDSDPALIATTRNDEWPPWVELLCADGLRVVQDHKPFDLIFADAPGGKIEGLDTTIEALAPRGILLVDDMDPALHASDGLLKPLRSVRDTLVSDPRVIAVEIPFSTHVILAARREPKPLAQTSRSRR